VSGGIVFDLWFAGGLAALVLVFLFVAWVMDGSEADEIDADFRALQRWGQGRRGNRRWE
jgi:hypothetical protein